MNKKQRIKYLEFNISYMQLKLQELENKYSFIPIFKKIDEIENKISELFEAQSKITQLENQVNCILGFLDKAGKEKKFSLLLNHLGLELKTIPEQPERIEIVKKDKHAKQKKS
jgi:hypothetical protein